MTERSWVNFFETRAFYDYEAFTYKLPLRYFRANRNIRSVSIDDTRRRRRRRRRAGGGGGGGCCLKVLLASLVVSFLFFLGAVASLFFLSSGNLQNRKVQRPHLRINLLLYLTVPLMTAEVEWLKSQLYKLDLLGLKKQI
ncbi:uncharacterized protein LOC106874128 isoform X2 [Octopus bimaculoides]|uniref:uncharacterized protein LOC106874128 isoform X2 n=1 Tax=Octopus bimaculoides TaxID=37653 RepID=UPI0022E6BC8A|nr:uncharacterized protein LOC106874128 isoform X2 [Octopus bimaculoides]